MLIQIIQNITLITAIVALYNIFPQLSYKKSPWMTILNGVLFGLTAILAMSMPFVAEKGIIYDGRSIVMALAGMFTNPVSAAMAALIAMLFRIFAVGGSGSLAGALTIAEATVIGVIVNYQRKKRNLTLDFPKLLLIGLAVHLLMLVAQLALPDQRWRTVIPAIAPSVLILYPLGFTLTSMLFLENERHLREHFQLTESEARYKSIFQNHHTVMIISEVGTGRMLDVNPAAEAYYGWSREQMLAMSLGDLKIGNDPSAEAESTETKSPFSPSHAEHRLSTGERRDVRVFSGPIEYFGKTVIFSIVYDTTAQREAERTINQLNQTLEQKVRDRTYELEQTNDELKAFAYSVSHDLRAPLRAIEGFSSLLGENASGHLNEQELHYLDRITYNSKKMSTLIGDLLRFSRVSSQPIAFSKVNLSKTAGDIIDELRQAEPDRAVNVKIQDGMTAYADEALIGVVLSNLLGNAWKFTSKTSAPTISFGCATNTQGENVFTVSDNGVGFDMTYADKLFSPFQRLHSDAEFSGSGIGLSLVRRIILRHGGKIWCRAAPGQGAQFFFTIGGNDAHAPV